MAQAVANPIVDARLGIGVPIQNNPAWAELLPEHLERMKISSLIALQDRIVNAQSAYYYDTVYAKVAVAIPVGAKQSMFLLGKGENSTQFGTATALGEKTEFHTNMISNGMFDSGTNFIMFGAGVQCVMSADLATTVAENGAITDANYTAAVTKSAPNHLLQVAENLELRFLRGEDIKKRGKVKHWAGIPGSGLEGASGSPNGGFFQLAQQGLVKFDYPVVLGSGERFQFDLVNVSGNAFTPALGWKLEVGIWGIAIKQQYPG